MTIKVRIAVVVDAKGGWNAYGWKLAGCLPMDDAELMATARDPMDDPLAEYIVTAELALPVSNEVAGKVEHA